jgi:hypothetical protein
MTARYRIRAWRTWSDADPSYNGEADTLDGARYICAHLTEPLIDVAEVELSRAGRPTGGATIVAVRRMAPFPSDSARASFVPRDEVPANR